MTIKNLQTINIAVNILLTLVLIAVIFSKDQRVDFFSVDNGNEKTNPQANMVNNIPTGSDLKQFTNFFEIHVNDGGYVDSDITANLAIGKEISITVINDGEKPHSFVIDPLKVNSGTINPGDTKKIVITSVPDETISYSFYSGIPDDSTEEFRGRMLVVKSETKN